MTLHLLSLVLTTVVSSLAEMNCHCMLTVSLLTSGGILTRTGLSCTQTCLVAWWMRSRLFAQQLANLFSAGVEIMIQIRMPCTMSLLLAPLSWLQALLLGTASLPLLASQSQACVCTAVAALGAHVTPVALVTPLRLFAALDTHQLPRQIPQLQCSRTSALESVVLAYPLVAARLGPRMVSALAPLSAV